VSASSIVISIEEAGFRLDTELTFKEPIGFEVYHHLRLDEETRLNLSVNRRNFKLSKVIAEQTDLKKDMNLVLKTVELIVNNVCVKFGEQVEKVVTLDSKSIDLQIEKTFGDEELQKRGEIPKSFGIIHAKGSKDAHERADGLVPLYKERDKAYLYNAKQVYWLLPHSFVVNLLRCDSTNLIRQEDFDVRGKDVLRDMVYRKYLKKRELSDGTTYYYGLNEKTQRHLKKYLTHKTSRF
jgi:hypothetical protein